MRDARAGGTGSNRRDRRSSWSLPGRQACCWYRSGTLATSVAPVRAGSRLQPRSRRAAVGRRLRRGEGGIGRLADVPTSRLPDPAHIRAPGPTPPAQLRFSVEHWAAFWANPHPELVARIGTADVVGYWPGEAEPVRGTMQYQRRIARVPPGARPGRSRSARTSGAVGGASEVRNGRYVRCRSRSDAEPGWRTRRCPRNQPCHAEGTSHLVDVTPRDGMRPSAGARQLPRRVDTGRD